MFNIYYALDYDDVLPMIQDGKPTIRQARLLASSYLNRDTVYVGNASDFFESEEGDLLVVHRHDMILIRGEDIADVFDEICEIIDTLNSWEKSLKDLIRHENGLQEMLDASSEILKQPAFIYAPDGSALAISHEYPASIHWHWAEILRNQGLTSIRMRDLRDSINLPEVFKDTYPTVRPSAMGSHTYMHCSLYPNDYMAGHFVLFGFTQEFCKGLDYLVSILVKWMTKHMETYYSLYSPTSHLAESFTLFFTQDSYDEKGIALLLRILDWHFDDTYQMFVIRERSSENPVLLASLYNDVTQQLPLVVSFVLDNDLIILENQSHAQNKAGLLHRLVPLIQDDFFCGVSNVFVGIQLCRLYYHQAQNEVERCKDTHTIISFASDYGFEQMESVLTNDPLVRTYAAPEIINLKAYDKEHETHFYETLRAYCTARFHLSEAARYLDIHRNTLAYRLKRMREIIDFSTIDKLIAQPNEQGVIYLLFSFVIVDKE